MLDILSTLSNLLCDVLDLDDGIGLDDAQKILLEERVVECGEVGADGDIGRELYERMCLE